MIYNNGYNRRKNNGTKEKQKNEEYPPNSGNSSNNPGGGGIILYRSFAYWVYRATQKTSNEVSSNCLKLNFTEISEAIKLPNAYPITDEEARNLTPYTFKLTNVCDLDVTYDVQLDIMDVANRLNSKYIAVEFNGQGKKRLSNYPSATPSYNESDYTAVESRGIVTGELKAREEVTYSIKLWIDESVTVADDAMNKSFISKIVVNASLAQRVYAYKEDILNGADPVLGEGLIPVVIADDGTVTKANIETEWYNYTNKVWANAVILEDKSIEYNNYDVIPESNIESYFVWIPRYKYKIWDEGQYEELSTIETKAHTIEVVFETKDVAASNGSTTNSWLTHPAFTAFGTNGIWVGKFESGYKGATSTTSAESNTNNSEKLQIKPNVYSWRLIQVANAHLTSYNYKRDMDSHMMKNTEWGAVAYLQHSAYGSQGSVRINNNSAFITGYAGVNEPTTGFTNTNISCSTTPEACNEYGTSSSITQPYNTTTGYLASTTGNISGVYDMSGGAWEYMMGILLDSNGNPMSGRHNLWNSGFKGTYGCPTCDSTTSGVDSSITSNTTGIDFPDAKYYDSYKYGTSATLYKNRILGDATGEMGPFQSVKYGTQTRQIGSWYADEAWFVHFTNPWFLRGGPFVYGSGAGVFDFDYTLGIASSYFSFRVVLAV